MKKQFLPVVGVLALAALLLLIGCTSPAVKQTSISGEVRQTEHWKIEWAGRDSIQTQAMPLHGLTDSNKYTHVQYCTTYVADIRKDLARKYNFSFAENFPDRGIIRVELTGGVLRLTYPVRDTASYDEPDDISPDGRVGSQTDPSAVSATGFRFVSRKDHVVSVRVSIYHPEGKLLGVVLIGGKPEDDVKPDFVARVIEEILRTGRYKSAERRVDTS
jgi:hypothetical protein